jgi:hypothetical protein
MPIRRSTPSSTSRTTSGGALNERIYSKTYRITYIRFRVKQYGIYKKGRTSLRASGRISPTAARAAAITGSTVANSASISFFLVISKIQH